MSSLTDGLIVYYPFDGNANDESENRASSKIQGGAFVDDRFGKPNKAYRFSGANDVLLIDKPISIAGDWTIAAWFNTQFPNNTWNTLTRGNAGDHQVIISQSGQLGSYDNVGGTGFKDSGFNAKSLPAGWHHVAASAADNKTSFYIDGKLVGSIDFQSKTDIYAIGNFQGGTQSFGTIDDVRIYNRALPAAEIKTLYDQGSNFKALIAYYPFDGNANDESGNQRNGKIQGAALIDDRFGKPNKAYRFSGTNDVLLIDKPISIFGDWTIAAWFNTQFPNNTWNTLTRGNAGDHQVIISQSGQLGSYDNVGGTGFKDSGFNAKSLPEGWHHVAASAADNKTSFYIDGKLVGSIDFQSKTDIYAIGNFQGGTQSFGSLDDVRIYNYALSESEITSLYDSESNTKDDNKSNTKDLFFDMLCGYCGVDKDCSSMDSDQIKFLKSIGITKEYLDTINAMGEDTKTMRIQILRGKAECFASKNPVLKVGEWAYETDTHKLKIGDGKTNWNQLSYKVDLVFTQILKDRIEKSQLIEEKGQPNGYAPLDENNKVPRKHLPETFGIKVVNKISDRDSISIKYDNMLIFVIDASADKTVEKGAAFYIWANSAWIKVSEFESLDIDFSIYFNKNKDNLDLIKEGDKYIHFSNDYKIKIDQNETNINDVKNNLRLLTNWLFECGMRKAKCLSGGECLDMDFSD